MSDNTGDIMKTVKLTDTDREAVLLRKKGLTDEKVIKDLIEFKCNNPHILKNRYPTEMYDKVNLMCRNFMDRLARFSMDYDFIVDEEKFKNTAVCCLESVPILRSQVINHPVAPYWRVADYNVNDFVIVEHTDDIDKTREKFFRRQIPLKSNIQMNIGLFYYEGRTYVNFIWNHMCMDGGGFRMFWGDFCKNYSDYVNLGVSPLGFSTGSRRYTEVYKDMPKEKAKKAKLQFANVSPRLKLRFPFENDNKEDNIIIVSRKISSEYFLNAKEYAKRQSATVTDLLLASYLDAFGKIAGLSENEKVSVACATDLRRHIKDLSGIGYTNHVSFMHCTLDKKGRDLKQTLGFVRDRTALMKDDEFAGLHGLPLLRMAYKNMIYIQAETIVKLFYNNPVFSVSNVGVISPSDFVLGEKGPFDAFVAGAAKNKPCAVMTALTINNNLSVSMCLRGNEKDKQLLEAFFTEFENNIRSFS